MGTKPDGGIINADLTSYRLLKQSPVNPAGTLRMRGRPSPPHNQGVHLPSVKVGFQRLNGQKRTEMIH